MMDGGHMFKGWQPRVYKRLAVMCLKVGGCVFKVSSLQFKVGGRKFGEGMLKVLPNYRTTTTD